MTAFRKSMSHRLFAPLQGLMDSISAPRGRSCAFLPPPPALRLAGRPRRPFAPPLPAPRRARNKTLKEAIAPLSRSRLSGRLRRLERLHLPSNGSFQALQGKIGEAKTAFDPHLYDQNLYNPPDLCKAELTKYAKFCRFREPDTFEMYPTRRRRPLPSMPQQPSTGRFVKTDAAVGPAHRLMITSLPSPKWSRGSWVER